LLNLSDSIPSFNKTLYNITFRANKTNLDYFNVTYNRINISDGGSLSGSLFQSLVNIYVNDSLTNQLITSFDLVTNTSSYAVSGGYILLPSKQGSNHFLNISGTSYPLTSITYSINAVQNLSVYINMSPRFQFYLRREADNSIFDVVGTNTTKLTIYCPNKNIVINFRNLTSNSTQENKTVDCAYTLMKMDVSYASTSYFRTLIPPKTQQNVTWWLLDLNQDTGVQIIINLVDLTGDFTSGIIRLITAVGGGNEDIIEQQFDISTSATLYLLKDGLYTVSLVNSANTIERQLGNLIADAAGTRTITYPNIPFYPENTILENNISWSYYFNVSSNTLRLQYNDATGSSTLIRWKIYNGSNTSSLLQTFTGTTNSSETFTYNAVSGNTTYFTELFVQNGLLTFNITDIKTWGDFSGYLSSFAGYTVTEAKNLKHYASTLFLVVWGLLFSAKFIVVGLVSTTIWMGILKTLGWFDISFLWVGLIGTIVMIAAITETMRRN